MEKLQTPNLSRILSQLQLFSLTPLETAPDLKSKGHVKVKKGRAVSIVDWGLTGTTPFETLSVERINLALADWQVDMTIEKVAITHSDYKW